MAAFREIEFFAQTQQLIAGGRNAELRVRPTLEALNILAATNWITFEARDELTVAYEFLRRVEHRLQMIADEQTHTLPDDAEAIERFARFFGYQNRDLFSRICSRISIACRDTTASCSKATPPARQSCRRSTTGQVLKKHACWSTWWASVSRSRRWSPSVQRWLRGEYRALKVEATHRAFLEAFVPVADRGLAKAEDPDAAVVAFDRFLQALQRGGRLITLLSQNGDLVALVALILGAAPRLGDMLARQPQIMDGLIDPRFFGAMPDQREISERLVATLGDAVSYEEFLDRLRQFGQESLFLIGARILSGTVSAQHASVAFADVAEGIVRTVHDLVAALFANQYGRIKGRKPRSWRWASSAVGR